MIKNVIMAIGLVLFALAIFVTGIIVKHYTLSRKISSIHLRSTYDDVISAMGTPVAENSGIVWRASPEDYLIPTNDEQRHENLGRTAKQIRYDDPLSLLRSWVIGFDDSNSVLYVSIID